MYWKHYVSGKEILRGGRMSDLINRQDAIDAVKNLGTGLQDIPFMAFVVNAIAKVPTADAYGKWIIKQDKNDYIYGECSECGFKQNAGELNFCPNCGARMRERREDDKE